ncbi:MAG: hypothetical protein ABRQ39_28835 [Candidatus Eremiobacterota bacterium]
MNEHIVNEFLAEFKEIILSGNFYLIPREKNIEGLINLGINRQQAKKEILDLTYENYYQGPVIDEYVNYKGDLWIFGKDINNIQTYIKLKIEIKAGKKIAKCISFHPADFTMKFSI